MLVQALAAYADTYLSQELSDPAFESKGVGYAIEVFEDGSFARLARRATEQVRGKKTGLVDLPLIVPKSPVNRNAGVYALPGCDAVQYLVGPSEPWTDESNDTKAKHLRQHVAFVERVAQVATETRSESWAVAAKFLRNESELAKARSALAAEKLKSGSVTLAVVSRDPNAPLSGTLVEEHSFKTWWRARHATDAGARIDAEGAAMCLVSGVVGPVAKTHDKVKGMGPLGGQAAGVALMSFDKKAFQSYGWDKNNNSPVSPTRATAYVLAFNDLLKPGRHRQGAAGGSPVSTRFDAGGTAFLFWTPRPTNDDLGSILSAPDDQMVRALLDSVRSGRGAEPGNTDDFFLAAVAGNGGRLVVRHWFRDSLSTIRGRLAEWFEAVQIADPLRGGQIAKHFPLWKLLLATVRAGAKSEDVSPEYAIELVRRAFQGIPVGHGLLGALLRRVRLAERAARLAPERIGLVRLCVNDLMTRKGSGEPMTATLDEGLQHPAYLCGRLLAVFEGLQWQAQGDVGVTVVDRYYALASTHPTVAFPKIEQLAQHHLKKLRRDKPGAAVALGRRLAELHELIARHGARFPGQLSLEDQGRFAIGFHHQKADDRARIELAKAQKSPETAA